MTNKSPFPDLVLKAPGAIIGTTGSGKTVTAKLLAETVMQRDIPLPFAAIDPMGVWWGLKLSADGTKKAFDVVLCGAAHDKERKPQPDIVITPDQGALVADLIAEKRLSIIVDMSGFEDDENFGDKNFPNAEDGEAKRDDENFSHASVWEYQGSDKEPKLHKEALEFEHVKLTQRSYK